MRKKFSLIGCLIFILAFSLFFGSNRQNIKVFAADTPGERGGSTSESGVQLQNLETVGIPISDKLVLKDGSAVQNVFNSTDDMVNLIVKVLFVGAGLVLFFMIIGAGFAMIKGSGGDKDKAKTTMTSALIGFVIMFSAYWIVQIIQLITGIDMNF